MTPVKFFTAMRHRRWTMLFCVIVALAAAGALIALQLRTFTSTEQVLVTAGSSVGSSASQNDAFAQQRAVAYAEIARGATVAERAADAIGLPLSPSAIAAKVTVAVVPTTSLIDITVTDTNAVRAQQLASAVGNELISMVTSIETIPGQEERALTLTVASEAQRGVTIAPVAVAQWLILALVAGLVVGAVVVWLRERLRPTVRGLFDVPITRGIDFGSIDKPRPVTGSDYVNTTTMSDHERDGLRAVRTSLIRSVGGTANPVFGVCASDGSQSSLAVSLLLGASFADSYRTTVVVETDVRNAEAAQAMALPATPGLSELLRQHTSLDDAAMPTPHRMLDLVSLGSPFTDDGELLGSRAMVEVMDDLKAAYDVVILVMPPLSSRPDALILGPRSDCVALLATERKTAVGRASEAVSSFADLAPVVGTIVVRR
ncbi:hypothetical protein ACNHUS_07105 [Actinomycetes bacterium M1A6_2h]